MAFRKKCSTKKHRPNISSTRGSGAYLYCKRVGCSAQVVAPWVRPQLSSRLRDAIPEKRYAPLSEWSAR